MTLKELGRLANENAHAHGFYDEPNPIPQQIALMHSELSEALECYRDGNMEMRMTDTGKPVGFPTELADLIIREAVHLKMTYNAKRPHRHGRRVL